MAQPRHVATPAYLVAFALVVIPPFDALMQVLPVRIHDARWRFGFFGLLSNAYMIPLTGLLVAFAVAVFLEHRRFQRVLGTLALIVAVGTVALLGMFMLDALQVRKDVNPAAALAFKVASVTALLKSGLAFLTLVAFGIAGWRGPKPARAAKEASPKSSRLIMGTRPGSGQQASSPESAG